MICTPGLPVGNPKGDGTVDDDYFGDLKTPTADYYIQQANFIPLRLSDDERLQLHLLEGALTVSDYTNKVDIVASGGR